jgi:hypothetical protein
MAEECSVISNELTFTNKLCYCNLGTLLVYYHWVKATVWWTVSQQSPSVFSTPVSKYFGTKNRYYFENWQYLKFSKFINLRSISFVQSSVFSWFWRYCLGPSGYLFSIRHCSFSFWSSKSFYFICTDET